MLNFLWILGSATQRSYGKDCQKKGSECCITVGLQPKCQCCAPVLIQRQSCAGSASGMVPNLRVIAEPRGLSTLTYSLHQLPYVTRSILKTLAIYFKMKYSSLSNNHYSK